MVAATVKFALETQRLAEVQRENDARMRDANINTSSEETVDSDNADDDPTAWANNWWYALTELPQQPLLQSL